MKVWAGRVAVCIVGLLMLVATWYVMFWWLAGATEILLAPWDTTPQRPPVGTLARSVNDFFEDAPGAYLPPATAVGASVVLFAVGFVRKRAGRACLPTFLAGANALFVVLDVLAVRLAQQLLERRLPPSQTGYDLGYNRTWLSILATAVLLAFLYWAQWRAVARPSLAAGASVEGAD